MSLISCFTLGWKRHDQVFISKHRFQQTRLPDVRGYKTIFSHFFGKKFIIKTGSVCVVNWMNKQPVRSWGD
jgi:hypothetical protein